MFGETQIPRNLFGILFRIWEKPLTSFSMKINIHCSSGGKGVPMKPVKLKWVKGKGRLGERLLFLAVTWVCKPGPAPTVSSGHCWHSATSCALCLLCTPSWGTLWVGPWWLAHARPITYQEWRGGDNGRFLSIPCPSSLGGCAVVNTYR